MTGLKYTTKKFQSTPSVGRATNNNEKNKKYSNISIHALRGEGDVLPLPGKPKYPYFNPRPPWGGRPPTSTNLL